MHSVTHPHPHPYPHPLSHTHARKKTHNNTHILRLCHDSFICETQTSNDMRSSIRQPRTAVHSVPTCLFVMQQWDKSRDVRSNALNPLLMAWWSAAAAWRPAPARTRSIGRSNCLSSAVVLAISFSLASACGRAHSSTLIMSLPSVTLQSRWSRSVLAKIGSVRVRIHTRKSALEHC